MRWWNARDSEKEILMSVVTEEYLKTVPSIYRDILAAFPKLEPSRKAGYGLAYQTLYETLRDRYSMGEIVEACEQMEQAEVVEIKDRFFVHPTEVGEQIIEGLTGHRAEKRRLPAFPLPPRE
jgi:hypothetical protein